MTIESLTIPLTNGSFKGSDYVSDIEDTQYVTLTDGGNLSYVSIGKFGKETPTESGDGPGGDDQFSIDLSGFDDDFDISIKSFDAGDTFYFSNADSWSNVGNVYTIDYTGSDGSSHTVTIDVESTNGTGIAGITITCFARGMMIETGTGSVPVESLNIGDNVLCGDGRVRPIRWKSKRHVNASELDQNPQYRPIRIRKDSLGDNIPNADLVVSPQHRILLSDWRADLMFGEPEVLVAAVHLINDRDITRDFSAEQITYYHFMFDNHQTVWSNGLQSESFFPGDTAVEGVVQPARDELFQLFPELTDDLSNYGQTCHVALKAHEAHAMLGGGNDGYVN